MVFKALVALALVISGVEAFPAEQKILPPVGTAPHIEGNGMEEVLEK